MSERGRLTPRRRELLGLRSAALAAVRRVMSERSFVEIEAPLLVRAPGLEVHIDPVTVGDDHYLITSPEFQLKRLLAGGMERIYSLCKCFREHEIGHQHAREFTLLEWYRAAPELTAIMDDSEALVRAVVDAAGQGALVRGGHAVDVVAPFLRLSVAEVMDRFAGVAVRGDESTAELRGALEAAGVDIGSATEWDDLFFTAFVGRVEPRLAELCRPVFVTDWPAPLAALARPNNDNPAVVDRFELYAGGLELANAFGELTDPVEQRRRFEATNQARARRGKHELPIDEKFLQALDEGLPPSAGIALGFDRLLMLATNTEHIDQVLAFAAAEL